MAIAMGVCNAQTSSLPAPILNAPAGVQSIDLATTLRLANARNLDIQIARQRLAEAKAIHESALLQFLPWLSPGVSYRRHDDLIQDVGGEIIDVHKQAYSPGATLGAQVDIGDALYKSLAAKQQVNAAAQGLRAGEQDAIFSAAQAYFDLAFAQAAIGIARESVQISADYEQQIQRAVEAGIAFKGDSLRVSVQTERNRLALRQALEQGRISSARLAQILHLNSAIELAANPSEFVPITLVETNRALDSLVQQALAKRPEVQQSRSLTAAAQKAKQGATIGPIIPSLGAQAFWGGLGGGQDGGPSNFGPQEDYSIGISWKLGPGGLFDSSRKRFAESRLELSRLSEAKLQDEITRQVVEALTRSQSASEQISTAQRAVSAAEEGLRLASQRKELGVGIVLENIQAEQDLTLARLDFSKATVDFTKAQYALSKAIGELE